MQPVTIAVTNFNGEDLVLKTLESAKSMTYPVSGIVVVDDGSTDRSVELITAHHPDVAIVRLPTNSARLNHVRNSALRASDTRLVFLVDNDVTFHQECLGALVEAMENLPQAAICTPLILQSDDRRTIYSSGHQLHYLCVSTDELRGAPVDTGPDKSRPTVGGGIQLIDKQALVPIGLFNENFALGWGDDGELHHRVNLSGNYCYSVPEAMVYHPPRERSSRTYGQIHNRWLTLLQSYSLRSVLLLLPALLMYELILIAFLAKRRELSSYARALRAVLASRSQWIAERRRIQSTRAKRDRDLMTGGPIYVPGQLLSRGWERSALRFLDTLFGVYWRGVGWLL